jgi:hypothetical protein
VKSYESTNALLQHSSAQHRVSLKVQRITAEGNAGRRTPIELMMQELDKHNRQDRSKQTQFTKDEASAIKNILHLGIPFRRQLQMCWGLQAPRESCWTIKDLNAIHMNKAQNPDCDLKNKLAVEHMSF